MVNVIYRRPLEGFDCKRPLNVLAGRKNDILRAYVTDGWSWWGFNRHKLFENFEIYIGIDERMNHGQTC